MGWIRRADELLNPSKTSNSGLWSRISLKSVTHDSGKEYFNLLILRKKQSHIVIRKKTEYNFRVYMIRKQLNIK